MVGMLLYVTFGLALVLAIRKPARQWFGAGPAFTLWLLPLLLAVLPWLPTLPSAWIVTPTLLVLPTAPALIAHVGPSAWTTRWPLLLWMAGTFFCLLRLALHYGLLLRQSRRLPPAMWQVLQADMGGLDPSRLRLHPAGPAVLWAPRSLLLIPANFLEHFDADQRRLVLQHECVHLRRGDAFWSLLAELAFALLWFHPLAWLARPRLRLDQELACDERVLRQSPQDETKYVHTLLHSVGMDVTPVLIPWLTEPQLKERLSMIQRHRPGTLRRHLGFISLTALMAGAAFVAQAALPTQANQPASTDLSFNSTIQPQYPQDAIKNKQQGIVILEVLVDAHGMPRKFRVNPATHAAPSLIKAATDVAMQWHFNPATKNGKPIESYARVPILFSLDKPSGGAPVPPVPSVPSPLPHGSSSS
jgi:TonB family protein